MDVLCYLKFVNDLIRLKGSKYLFLLYYIGFVRGYRIIDILFLKKILFLLCERIISDKFE